MTGGRIKWGKQVRPVSIIGLGMLLAGSPLAAASVAETVAAIAAIRSSTGASASRDGRRIAYIANASGSPQVWAITGGDPPVQLTRLPDPVQSVAWSPAGDWLAYDVAPGGGLNVQVHVMRPDGSGDRLVTAGGQSNNRLFGWTKDGKALRIGSAAVDPARFEPQLVNPATGTATGIGKGSSGLGDLIVGKDGRIAVVDRAVTRGDSNIWLVDRASGAEQLVTPHEGRAQFSTIDLSPDGRRLWLIGNAATDRYALVAVDIDAAGKTGPMRTVLARVDAELENAVLSEDGATIALFWNKGGRSELAWFDTRAGKERAGPVLPFDLAGAPDFAADGKSLLFTGSGAAAPANLYRVQVADNALTRLTDSAHDGVDLAALVRPRLLEWTARDGVKLSGWLYAPAGAAGPQPMVFLYHGGPEGQSRPSLSSDVQALVANGISVLLPNVRGSSGAGRAFMELDNGPLRVNGVTDIADTSDFVVKAGLADPKRLGIMGGSYGGYMVMAGVTAFPKMFAAGVNLFGVVNFDTFFKNTQPWMAAISTVEYGDPVKDKAMLARLSPLNKIGVVTTPLLVLHGANDTNVPVIEAEQIVASLKGRGVPVEYILFPDEGHGWRKLPNRVRSTTAIVGFFRAKFGM
ncbi:S9 family peptidase [Sandarakinorhabdus sp. DWP1-3-1]|uniref:S9 family peptidase n=1 Tax=Sandarakinorhabdus sp. DWP1-3-1 TaxID=2804627 RepID=UPI003CEB2212